MLVESVAKWIWLALGDTRIEVLYSLLVFVAVLLTVRLVQWYKYTCTLPPGPWGIPFIGSYFHVKRGSNKYFLKLAKKYGPTFSVRLGTELFVCLSDYRDIRDAFRREEYTGRPHNEFMNILDGYGIINSDGPMWKDERRFLHDKLRNFGMSHMGVARKNLESKIKYEVDNFLRGLELRQGTATSLSSSLSMSISNVICSIIMGIRFHHGDPRFKRFMDLIHEGFRLFGKVVIVNYIPILRHLPGMQGVRNKLVQNRNEMIEFFKGSISQHKATFNKDNIRDVVDNYLVEIQQVKDQGQDEKTAYHGKNYECQLEQILADLFSAGMETIKTTLEWSVVMMMHYPKAAKAVQEELDQVVGRSRMPSLEDLPYLPITEATILEVLRRSSIVPLGTTHATTRDVTLNGHFIPAGTQIVPLLQAVHMNPDLWENPEEFRPSRFLTPEGKVYKPECFMPFGVGRRMCLGDVLAKMEIYLFFSSILHSFDIKSATDTLPSMEGISSVTITPIPFKVCMLKRSFDVPECEAVANEAAVNGPVRNIGSH